ncbi:MAG: hypothetical protein GX335_09715, partial [Firmicutes bacterium]|nr:hypothetical protein [Bacillota bacterium]
MTKTKIIICAVILTAAAALFFQFSKNYEVSITRRDALEEANDIEGGTIMEKTILTLEGKEIELGRFPESPADYLQVDFWAPCVFALSDYQKNIDYFQANNIRIAAVSA